MWKLVDIVVQTCIGAVSMFLAICTFIPLLYPVYRHTPLRFMPHSWLIIMLLVGGVEWLLLIGFFAYIFNYERHQVGRS